MIGNDKVRIVRIYYSPNSKGLVWVYQENGRMKKEVWYINEDDSGFERHRS